MNLTQRLIGFSIASAIVFYLADLLIPNLVEFGNIVVIPGQAILTAALGVGVIAALVDEIARDFNLEFSENAWMFIYFLVNSGTIYVMARTPVSNSIGIGIVAFWVALGLGFFVNLAQFVVWKALQTEAKKK